MRSSLEFKSRAHNGLTGPTQVFFKLPVTAAPGLSCHDQIQARDKSEVLPTGPGLGARVRGNTLTASTAFAGQARRQFPAVGEDLRIKLPPQFGRLDVMCRRGGF